MKRRLITLTTVFMLAIASGSVAVHGQDGDGEGGRPLGRRSSARRCALDKL